MRPTASVIIVLLILLATGRVAAAAEAGFKVVAHEDFPVDRIDRDELKKILLGTRTTLAEAHVDFVLLDGGEAHAALTREVAGKSPRAFSAYWKRRVFSGLGVDPPTLPSDRSVAAYLRTHRRTIGYVAADTDVDLDDLKVLKVED